MQLEFDNLRTRNDILTHDEKGAWDKKVGTNAFDVY